VYNRVHKIGQELHFTDRIILDPTNMIHRIFDSAFCLIPLCYSFQNSEKTYTAATKEIEAFNLEKAEELLVENLEQLSGSLYPPFKDYSVSQEAYMKCILYKGNRRVKPASQM